MRATLEMHQTSATNFKAAHTHIRTHTHTHTHEAGPACRQSSRKKQKTKRMHGNFVELETFTKVFVVFSFTEGGSRFFFSKSPRLPTMFISAAPFPINTPPALLAERKWLLLAIASYMSLCNATEHSLFKKKRERARERERERQKDWLALETPCSNRTHTAVMCGFNVDSVAGGTRPKRL